MLRLFIHFSVILIIFKNEWLATKSQNAILNNFEEYYKLPTYALQLLVELYIVTILLNIDNKTWCDVTQRIATLHDSHHIIY